MEIATLIPNRLSYGPTGSATSGQARLAFDDIAAPEFRKGCYEVCHYHSRSLGGCDGPLAIDQTLWFGREIHIRLQEEGKPVAVEYEPEERHNVAVVVGAYLVLGLGWSANEVRGALPEDAGLTLPCSWIDPGDLKTSHGAPCMTVQDCWEGVQVARDLGWLQKEMVRDGVVASLVASKFWKTCCEYDGAWLVPGVVFVMADPMTTIKDPNPKTCAAFCKERGADHNNVSEVVSLDDLKRPSESERPSFRMSTSGAFFGEKTSVWPEVRLSTTSGGRDCDEFKDGQLDKTSVNTACKVYDSGAVRARGCDFWPEARPFVDFLLEEGIKTVLRLNTSDEPGLADIGGSYDAGLLAEFGIHHADVPVSDSKGTQGAVPPRGAIKRFFCLTSHVGPEDGGAVLVHCKGGFGRSVFMACLLIMYKYNVPGRALLGWARIARPGAITTPEQEAAMRSLSGRADICRRYGIPCEGPDDTPGAGQADLYRRWYGIPCEGPDDTPGARGCCTVS